ncbi:MAG: SDR family NAD(P)-dependent oxidoreductase [archaeon]
MFKGKVVLITGGTGFLGRALTKEILKQEPASIRIFSRDEVKHHKFQEEFNHDNRLRNLIGDVRDYSRVKKACIGVDIVIHAAALKRLDILEYNVEEAIKTNIYGTQNIVNACLECNVEKAVFVSSDKACSPVNTYGACKFVGERIFIETNYSKGKSRTIFSVVRYGNVLESTGSVIPFFESKIREGKKIPITHSEMTRFIISPMQAVDLVFFALEHGVGGEIFVPTLPAFQIMDLVDILKEKHRANSHVEIIGVRPGEKLHELMINTSEIPRTYRFKDKFVIKSSIEKYQDINVIEYVNEKNRVKDMAEYSSKQGVIPKKDVEALFKQFGII